MKRLPPNRPALTRPPLKWCVRGDVSYVVVRALPGYRVRVTIRRTHGQPRFTEHEARTLTFARAVTIGEQAIDGRLP